MKKFLSKNLSIQIRDIAKGTNIIKTLKFLNQSQYWDQEKIYNYQLHKLRKLVEYASINVPYYSDLFDNIGFSSSDIKTLDDINKIPILTKEIVRREGNRLVSTEPKKFKIKYGKTGGTTGVPVQVLKDQHNRSFTWASYYRWYNWMGINYWDNTATLWGAKTVLSKSKILKIKKIVEELISNSYVINAFEMTEKGMEELAIKMKRHNTILIKGYVSSLLQFADYVSDNNISFPNLKAVSSTTETLLPHNREYLMCVFKVPIYDQYGCGEVSAISYECSHHKGLHVNLEHVICETLDKNNRPLINKSGRVVVTDLDNYIMPFIRFDSGDNATLNEFTCDCGVKQPIMESIEGRSSSTVTLKSGVQVHGVFFTDIFYELGIDTKRFQRFQLVQYKDHSVELKIESISKLNTFELTKLKNALGRFLDKVEIMSVKKIETEPNGKFLYIKKIS